MSTTRGFRVESHVKELTAEMESKIPAILEKCGLVAEGYAKRLCPVDTGNLRNSITHVVVPGESTVYIGTNVYYGPYVEMGTVRTKAQPFIKPAIVDNKNVYETIIFTGLIDL